MTHTSRFLFAAGFLLTSSVFAQNTPVSTTREPKAPPTAPPMITADADADGGGPQFGPWPGQTQWSIGQPTDEEQLYLEYINRSRANPTAEGTRLAATTDPEVLSAYDFFGVDLTFMQQQFATNPPVPPIAMNERLLIAARLHSGDMFTNQFQGHTGSTGSTLGTRLAAQGYPYTTAGENVYSYAESVWHGHAGFNVDWGYGPGGMQSPPGHRNTIHNGALREVGVGIVNGINGPVGPQLVTQDFGTRSGNAPIISGVVYYDFNGNNFYDLGEGIGGVVVDTPGAAYYAVTADSGGYAIPVSTNGNYNLTFSTTGLNRQSVATVTTARNVKVDYVPAYSPPVVSGPSPASVGLPNTFTFTQVGGATSYDWQVVTIASYSAVEGAENMANVTVVSSPGYSVQSTDYKVSGTYSFHLAHPEPPTTQILTLNASVRVTSTSALSFQKRLSWASTTQVARAQVSADGGITWQDVWSLAGNNGAGDNGFSPVTVSLAAYAGQTIRVRFSYSASGSYFPQTDPGVGLYLDNIAISNAEQLLNPTITSVPFGTSFTFTPTAATNYALSVRARINSRILPWGPSLQISAAAPPPTLQLVSKPIISGNQVQVDFTVSNYRAGMTFQLWKSSSPAGSWAQDATATLSTIISNSKFRLTTTTGGASQGYYRVRAAY